jgi:hypothetical protein
MKIHCTCWIAARAIDLEAVVSGPSEQVFGKDTAGRVACAEKQNTLWLIHSLQ